MAIMGEEDGYFTAKSELVILLFLCFLKKMDTEVKELVGEIWNNPTTTED